MPKCGVGYIRPNTRRISVERELSVAHDSLVSDGYRCVRKEEPAPVRPTHRAADLFIVSETHPQHACSVAEIRQGFVSGYRRQLRIRPNADFAELIRSRLLQLGFHRRQVLVRLHFRDASASKLQPDSARDKPAHTRLRNHPAPIDRALFRPDPHHPRWEFYFTIDAHLRVPHPQRRGVAILLVHRTIANAER